MIYRKDHSELFVSISNDLARNLELSDGAFRLLTFMLSMSDDWDFSVKGLASQTGWPQRKIMRLVSELKKTGHIDQKLRLDDRGKFLPSVWDVYEEPVHDIRVSRNASLTQRVTHAKRDSRSASLTQRVKSAPIRKPLYKENQNDKENQKEKKGELDAFDALLQPLTPELKQTFKDFLKMRKTLRAPMTVKALDLAIKRADKLGGGDPGKMKAIVEQSIMNSWKGLYELNDRSASKRSKHAKWRTGAEAGLKTETETRAPVSKLSDAQDIPNDILDLFGN